MIPDQFAILSAKIDKEAWKLKWVIDDIMKEEQWRIHQNALKIMRGEPPYHICHKCRVEGHG